MRVSMCTYIYVFKQHTHMHVTSRDDLRRSHFRCGMLCCRRVLRACVIDGVTHTHVKAV